MTKRCRARIAEAMRATAAAWGLVGVIVSPGSPTPRIISPGGRSPRIGTVGAGRSFRCVELVQQALDTGLAGDRFVVVELELRRASQAERRSDAPLGERRRASDGLRGALPRLVDVAYLA